MTSLFNKKMIHGIVCRQPAAPRTATVSTRPICLRKLEIPAERNLHAQKRLSWWLITAAEYTGRVKQEAIRVNYLFKTFMEIPLNVNTGYFPQQLKQPVQCMTQCPDSCISSVSIPCFQFRNHQFHNDSSISILPLMPDTFTVRHLPKFLRCMFFHRHVLPFQSSRKHYEPPCSKVQ